MFKINTRPASTSILHFPFKVTCCFKIVIQVLLPLLYLLVLVTVSLNSSNSLISSASLIPWISLMPPSQWHSFRKCLRVSSAPDSHSDEQWAVHYTSLEPLTPWNFCQSPRFWQCFEICGKYRIVYRIRSKNLLHKNIF